MKHPRIPGLNIPVRTIFCIGRNYAKHAEEMGADIPESPVVFLKPLSSICYDGSTVHLPTQSSNIHFEGEIVVAIGRAGKDIPDKDAFNHIAGIGCGIDFTARDLQKSAKQNGLPWSISKGFENFAPISEFIKVDRSTFNSLSIKLEVNGIERQNGTASNMIFSIPSLISYLSTITTLYDGDLIFTGTPEGVGQVETNDKVKTLIPELDCSVSVQIV